MSTRLCLALPLLLVGSFAHAKDHAAVRAAIERMAPAAKVESIAPAAMPGLLEVVVNGEVLYVSDDGKFLIHGRLFDTAQRVDRTAETEKSQRAGALKQVSNDQRLRYAAAKPKHRVTIFTDIDCGYCRKLHQEMASYNAAGITVDYLFFPRAGLNSESFNKAQFVWCSKDQKKVMDQSMSAAGLAIQPLQCDSPIPKTLVLGQRYASIGTPTIISEDGTVLGGYQSAADLSQRLEQLATATAP
jgi:thiol:disulfide interchange protein DsbC